MTTFLDYKMTYKKNKLCLLLASIIASFTILFHLNSKRSYTLEINIYFEDFTFSKRSPIQVLYPTYNVAYLQRSDETGAPQRGIPVGLPSLLKYICTFYFQYK